MNNENTKFNVIRISAVITLGCYSAIYCGKRLTDGKWSNWIADGMMLWDSKNTADAEAILNAISGEVEAKANSYIANDENFIGTSNNKEIFKTRFGKYFVSVDISWRPNYKALAEARA